MTSSFLRASLFTSVVAFGVAALVVGLGVLFILVGLAIMALDRRQRAMAAAGDAPPPAVVEARSRPGTGGRQSGVDLASLRRSARCLAAPTRRR